MDKNEKCRQLPVIKTQESAWKGGTLSDGTIQLPYPVYSEESGRVMELFEQDVECQPLRHDEPRRFRMGRH